MKMKKLAVLIIGTMFFWNLHAGLVTHLEFEDNFKDRYGNNDGDNASSTNDVSFDTGKEGRAIYFDGNDYIEVGENDFDPRGGSSTFSLSIWVKTGTSNSDNNCYVAKNSTIGTGNEFLFGYWNSKLMVQVGDSLEYVSTTPEPVSSWTHYVVTSETLSSTSTFIEVYRNGALIADTYLADQMYISSVSAKKWVLGMERDGSTPSDHFQGTMDNLRFYDKVITAEEVTQIYIKESAYLHLKFDDDYEDRVAGNDGIPHFNSAYSSGVDFIEGMENRSIDLAGTTEKDEYVEFGTPTTDPRGTNGIYKDYSISMWVKSDAAGTNNCYIGKHNSTGGNVFLFGYWSETLRLQISSTYATVSTTAEPTEWTHYVITGRESQNPVTGTWTTSATVYKNGSQLWSGGINNSLGTMASDYKLWVLGQDWDSSTSTTDHFNGKIDNVRFYKRLLSLSEVQALYSSEFTGVRYCNAEQNSSCTVERGTVFDLSQRYWWVQSGLFGFLVSNNNMDSVRVSEGWEVYLCTSTNNSSCGIYGEGLHRNINGGIYSMTVMPSTFEYAMKYYGIKEIGQSGTEPTGFAYLYSIPEYNYSSGKRMFIKESDSGISDLSNYIVKNNQISSVELFGDIALAFGKPSSFKNLYSSHRNFGWFGYDNNNSYLDFRDWDNAINYVMPVSTPSVGWFFAGDSSEEGEIRGICFDGVNDFPQESDPAPKIECITNGENHYVYKTNVDGGGSYNYNEFFNRLVVTNDQGIRHSRERFKRYGDSHDLLFFTSHGYFNGGRANIIISPSADDGTINSNNTDWANYIGGFKTKWMMNNACETMGIDGVDINPDVINAYKNSLERLNGVGGQRNDSVYGPLGVDHEDYFNFWDELDSEPISETYVDSWSNDEWYACYGVGDCGWYGRDARYMTRENCDCNNTSCDSYMFDDYFPTVSTGAKAKKNQSQLSTYNHYCVRDDDGNPAHYVVNSLNRSATVESKYDTDVYSKENPVAKIYQTYEMPPEIAGEMFDVEVSESGKTKYRDEYTHFTLDGRRLFYKGTEKLSPIDDEYPISENDYEKLFLDEATGIAEQLTTLPIVFDKISLDQTTSFIDQEYMIEMESIKTNKVSYIYVPVLDGIPMVFNKIEIQFDAKGLYKIKSFAPYSVEELGISDLKSSEDVVAEVEAELKVDSVAFDNRNIRYTIEKDGTARMKYFFFDKEERLIKTVSMEADYEK